MIKEYFRGNDMSKKNSLEDVDVAALESLASGFPPTQPPVSTDKSSFPVAAREGRNYYPKN